MNSSSAYMFPAVAFIPRSTSSAYLLPGILFEQEINLSAIKYIVCRAFDVHPEKIFAKSRKKEVVMARAAYCLLSRDVAGAKLRQISHYIGWMTHGTVINACRSCSNMIDSNKKYRNKIAEIRQEMKRSSHVIGDMKLIKVE